MNYIYMRYVVSMLIGLPLAMNGMLTQQFKVRKKSIVTQKMQKRSFFSENCDFFKLIANPRHSPVDVDEVIRREVTRCGEPLCLAQVKRVQTEIVLEALKQMSANITVLQPRFEGEKYNHNFNVYHPDAHYAYALAEFHRQVRGKICWCNRTKRYRKTSTAWHLARQYGLDNMFDELKNFDEIVYIE